MKKLTKSVLAVVLSASFSVTYARNGINQNVLNSLGGKVAGVQVVASNGAPGSASRLIIRGGAKSLTRDNEPFGM